MLVRILKRPNQLTLIASNKAGGSYSIGQILTCGVLVDCRGLICNDSTVALIGLNENTKKMCDVRLRNALLDDANTPRFEGFGVT